MGFTGIEYEILTFIEQEYLLSRAIPSAEVVADRCSVPVSKVTALWKREDFRTGLTARGIDLRESANGRLTAEQLAVANTLLDFADTRSDKKKLSDLGVNTQTYQGWLRDPGFQQYLQQRTENLFGDLMPDAHRALADNVRRGDLGAIKLYYEMSGRWSSKTVGELNVEFLLMKILEVVQKHVQDPIALTGIADELMLLAPNKPVGALPAPPVAPNIFGVDL